MEVNPVAVSVHPHPVLPAAGMRCAPHRWRPGQAVREMLLDHGVDPALEIVVFHNDRLLTVEEWDTVCPAPGDLVNVKAVVSGNGDDGSNPLAVVLAIVVAIVAWYAAPAVWGLEAGAAGYAAAAAEGLTAYVGITSAVIGIAGNALISALFAPSGRALADANGQETNSPTYSLSGGSNAIRPYQPLPVVMGTHRIFPDFGAKPFTELDGDDQYLYMLFNFGLSSATYSDFRIGDTPLGNYNGITTTWSNGSGQLPGFPGNVDTAAGGELIRGAGWVQRTTSDDTTRIAVDVEGVCAWSNEQGLTECTVTVEVYYSVAGANSWQPLGGAEVISWSTHYWSLNDGTTQYAFDPVEANHTENETQVIRAGFYDGGGNWVAPLEAAWHWVWFSNNSPWQQPDPLPTYSAAGSLVIAHGASQKAQRRTASMSVPSGKYDVRARLTSAMSAAIGEISESGSHGGYSYAWSALRSYQEDSATYSGQTRCGMKILASGQLNGVVRNLSAVASAHCLYWAGTAWKFGPTSSPAWWYLDFAIGRYASDTTPLYGCFLEMARIDIEAIKAWATFCVDEGLTCNLVIDRTQSASDVLAIIARCGFASPSWASGKLGVVWDKRNASPVAAFGMANIIKGSFSVQYVTENLADEIVVNYVNAADDYKQDQVRVLTPGTTTPLRSSTVEAMGCTSEAMAGKFANLLAAQQVYRRRMITWDSDFEGMTCQRGDVVLLQHDLTQWAYSGRLVNVAGAVLTLDRPVPRNGSAEYCMIAQPDGTLTTYTVTAGSGTSDTITLTASPTLQGGEKTLDHRWFFSPLATPGKLVKIVSVRPVSVSRVSIVATDEDPAYYAAWNGTWTKAASATLLRNATPRITSIAISETLGILSGDIVGTVINVNFSLDNPFERIAGRWRIAGNGWTMFEQYAASLEIRTVDTGLFEIEAAAVCGVLQGATARKSLTLYGKAAVPGDVTSLYVVVSGGLATLSFDPAADLDVRIGGAIEIRHQGVTSGAVWENAQALVRAAGSATSVQVPAIAGSYLAKWRDSSGNLSAGATTVVIDGDPAALLGLNVVATLDDSPAWAGTAVSCGYDEVVGGLKLGSAADIDSITANVDTILVWDMFDDKATSGTYTLADTLDIGSVQPARVTGALSYFIDAQSAYVDFRGDVDAWPDVEGAVSSSESWAALDVATSNDGSTWSDWQPWVAGDLSFRHIKARVRLVSTPPDENIIVTGAVVTVDMPDRVESGADIACPAAVTPYTYATPFMLSPSLAIAGQDMATGDYYTVSGKTASGFSIVFRNAAGTAVSRTFDYLARGY